MSLQCTAVINRNETYNDRKITVMNNYRLKLKKLSKKTLIQLIKRLRKEAARLHGALDRITERQDRLQEKYKDLQVTHELQKADFAAVTDGMSGQEIAQQIRESEDFSLEEEEEIGWVITYTESGRTEQNTAELVASSSQEAKSKFLETMEHTNRICHEASPKMFPNTGFTYKIISVEPKEVEDS